MLPPTMQALQATASAGIITCNGCAREAYHVEPVGSDQVDDRGKAVQRAVGGQVAVAGVAGDARPVCQIGKGGPVRKLDGRRVGQVLLQQKRRDQSMS